MSKRSAGAVMTAAWADLNERLERAARNLDAAATKARVPAEARRLLGKAEGVRLALTYVAELLDEPCVCDTDFTCMATNHEASPSLLTDPLGAGGDRGSDPPARAAP